MPPAVRCANAKCVTLPASAGLLSEFARGCRGVSRLSHGCVQRHVGFQMHVRMLFACPSPHCTHCWDAGQGVLPAAALVVRHLSRSVFWGTTLNWV